MECKSFDDYSIRKGEGKMSLTTISLVLSEAAIRQKLANAITVVISMFLIIEA